MKKISKNKKLPVIAVAPIRYFDMDKEHNLKKIQQTIGKAAKRGADLVCFPEACVTDGKHLLLDGPLIRGIGAACKKHAIWCIVTEDVKLGDRIFNSAVLINRNGKVKGHYEKIYLCGDDTHAGTEVRVFKTDFAKIGIAICWDLTFPRLFNEMKLMGAEIVFCPAKWYVDIESHPHSHTERETNLLRSLVLARAHENVFYVALCNPYLEDADQISYSAIADPHRILVELVDKEGIITAPVDIPMLRKFRKFYKKP